MKVIVAGSRSFADSRDEHELSYLVHKHMDKSPWEFKRSGVFPDSDHVGILIHGGAEGIDQAAADIAKKRGLHVHAYDPRDPENEYTQYSAQEHGKSAFPMRNEEMAKEADALLAIWDGESNGTRIMIDKALQEKLDICIKVVN